MSITLNELLERAKERADMEDGNFVSDAEWTHIINDEIKDLYAEMVNVDDGKLFGTVSPTLVQIGNNAYQLPNDFMRLVDVNVYSGDRWIPCDEADPQAYFQLLSDTYTGDYDTRYFLHRNQEQGRYELFLFPAKDVADIGVRYIKEAPTLSVGSDTLKWPSSWHEPVVAGAAARALIKEESDATGVLMDRDRGRARVLKEVRAQKVSEVKTLRDIGRKTWRRSRFRLPRIF